jgi:hypothetical protein
VRDLDETAGRAAHPGSMPPLPPDPHRLPPPGAWFAPDAARHLLDRPKFCPMCAASLERGLVSEWWSAEDRIFLTWCSRCRWTGNVVLFARAVIEEPEH